LAFWKVGIIFDHIVALAGERTLPAWRHEEVKHERGIPEKGQALLFD
jgi:hypothetical protein